MTKKYQQVKNQIWLKKVKSWTAFLVCGMLTVIVLPLLLTTKVLQKGAQWSKDYSIKTAAEAEVMKKNAQQANERDNQEFLNGLKKETAKEVVVKEVDSDLEDEGFAELSVA